MLCVNTVIVWVLEHPVLVMVSAGVVGVIGLVGACLIEEDQ